jgi:hypothetical protein
MKASGSALRPFFNPAEQKLPDEQMPDHNRATKQRYGHKPGEMEAIR